MRKTINNQTKPIETLCLCRVSSDKQAKKETILSQKQACLDYARNNGFVIDKFFYEEGVSGWKDERPGLNSMMEYITEKQKSKRIRVLFFDMSRLSRNLEVFSHFERIVMKYDIELLTVMGGKTSNTATGRFMRGFDVLRAQMFSDELSENTIAKMRSQMQMGYYPLNPPLGLKRHKDEHKKVILVRDEPRANIIAQMFEKYASGEITTKHALADFLNSFKVWNGKHLSDTQINDMLHNDVYTGVFAYDRWEIARQEWKMDKLIPMSLFNRVQERLNKDDKQPYKSNIADDFPLRHEIVCEFCGQPLTGYYAKSGTKAQKHPYYRCFNKACSGHTHSIRKKCVEDALVAKLATLNVSDAFLDLCCAMIAKVGDLQERQEQKAKNEIINKLNKINEQIQALSGLVARAAANNDNDMVEIYEAQIKENNVIKQELTARLSDNTTTTLKEKFRTAIERGREFFKRPDLLWTQGTLAQKQRLVRLIFNQKPAYHTETGFRTASTPQIFNENTAQTDGESDLAAPLGFEPGFSP